MTPSQRRNAPLSDATCFHEIGHLYVALCLGFPCDLDFATHPGTDAGAAPSWGSFGSPLNRSVFAMAGVYAQLVYAEETIPPALRESVRSGRFFTDMVVNQEVSTEAYFFFDDLRTIWGFVLRCRDQNEQLSLVRQSVERVQQLFAAPHSGAVFHAIHGDILTWIDEEDPSLYPDSLFAFYPNARAKLTYEREGGTTG